MQDFLMKTLSGRAPVPQSGGNDQLLWRWLDEGILEMTPHLTTDRAVVVSAGLHGNETAPVEIVNSLVSALLAGEKKLIARLLVIYGNPPALRENKRYLYCDINRLFGGRWQQYEDCPEAHRAWRLEQAMETFWQAGGGEELRWHLDLHTAIRGSYHPRFAVLPLRESAWPEDFLNWLSAAGFEALVFHRTAGGTFSHYSSQHFSVASATLELGKAQPFGENDISAFNAVYQALLAVVCGDRLPETRATPKHYRVAQQINRDSADFILHMSKETLNFAAFSRGTLLAECSKKQYYAQQEWEYVLFPNPEVAIGQRAGLMLVESNV